MPHIINLWTMRITKTAALLVSFALLSTSGAGAQQASPRAKRTPPGQVKILTVNARQNGVLGLKRFEDMYELSWAVRKRPAAFDGGYVGAVAAPDVVTLQEVRTSNVEIFVRLLRQRFKAKYQSVGPEEAASQILYNPETVTPSGDPVVWDDVCSDRTPGKRDNRFYEFARFTENKTGQPFVVAGMHVPKNFFGSDRADCYLGNIEMLRTQLALETAPTFIAGDFNRRAVEQQHECDPDERSPEFTWHKMLTNPADGGRRYLDSVRQWHRSRGVSLADQWTHEQKGKSEMCNGSRGIRRARIDYIFASEDAVVAEATVDAPGWSGGAPGTKNSGNHKYSDHRFVWARFVIGGPSRPQPPELVHGKRGSVTLTWQPVTEALEYVVYRALPGRKYSILARVDAATTSYVDSFTEHGVTYRYTVAAVGTNGSQSLESRSRKQLVDARGPQLSSVYPSNGSVGIPQKANIRLVFSERIKSNSVTNDRIRLFRGSKRIPGTVRQIAPRVIVFDPTFPLWKGKTHRVVTKPFKDKYGNVGGAGSFSFTVERPRKKKG